MGGYKERVSRRRAGFRKMDEAVKAVLQDERVRRSQREFEEEQGLKDQQEGLRFLEERRRFQLDRALKHVCAGTATPQDIDYFFRHADELGPTVIVGVGTIVDFTNHTKKELPDAA